MKSGQCLIRCEDNKKFVCVQPGHWSDIVAYDGKGEHDDIKWYGDEKDIKGRIVELYVSSLKGFSYRLLDETIDIKTHFLSLR